MIVRCITVFTKKKLPHVFVVTARTINAASLYDNLSPSNNFLLKKIPSPHKYLDLKIIEYFLLVKKLVKKFCPLPFFGEGRKNSSNQESHWYGLIIVCKLCPAIISQIQYSINMRRSVYELK